MVQWLLKTKAYDEDFYLYSIMEHQSSATQKPLPNCCCDNLQSTLEHGCLALKARPLQTPITQQELNN